jgi:hypothetical protein
LHGAAAERLFRAQPLNILRACLAQFADRFELADARRVGASDTQSTHQNNAHIPLVCPSLDCTRCSAATAAASTAGLDRTVIIGF